ncbi:MAG: SDR family NAD(P)-dependent oxidoreductase [Mycobacterium sp.]
MRLTGNTILVTGGGSGIGAGLAAALHHGGNRVIIAGRRREALEAVVRAHPGMECLPFDQSDPECVDAFADEVVRRHPELNVLVNNAGIMAAEDLTTPDPRVIRAVCATNLIGPLLLTSRLLPTLRKRPRAAIVNVSSALAFVPMASLPTYSATKAAMHAYTESLRFQLRHSRIQVVEIPPPRVYTGADGAGGAGSAGGAHVDGFVAETMALMAAHPGADEVVVDAARFLRFAERRGDYEKAYATVNPERGTS